MLSLLSLSAFWESPVDAAIQHTAPINERSQVASPSVEPTKQISAQKLYDHPPAPVRLTHQISQGDTLAEILSEVGVRAADRRRIFTCGNDCKSLSELKMGASLHFLLDQEGHLLRLTQAHRYGDAYQFTFFDDRIELDVANLEKTLVPTFKRVVIEPGESPISAANRIGGIKESTVFRATRILEYDIDFWRNIRPGDWFEIYYEKEFIGDEHVRDASILVLRFQNRGKLYDAYLHSDGSHYESDGAAKQKQFLRAPLVYKRISSNFSSARKHPIYGYTRAHRGVDYAAPTGTPVRVTSNGIVRKAKRGDPQAGNFLDIEHANGYRTRYLHLHGFAKGIRPGVSVNRGTTIGYVGSTGASTGPHLHYEVIENDRHLDPLKIRNPNTSSLEGMQLTLFLDHIKEIDSQISLLRNELGFVEQVASSN